MPVSVDIILPCYNPGDSWTSQLADFYEFVAGRYDLRFIVVNDGSEESVFKSQVESVKRKKIPVATLSNDKNRGKGFTLRRGVEFSDGELILYTDIDFPFTNESTFSLLEALALGSSDVVAGYRDESYYLNKMSGFRIRLSRAFRFFIRRFLRLQISDTQCGLKGFNRKGREIFLKTRTNRYLFDFEFIYLVSRISGLTVSPVPVKLKDKVTFRKMRLKILMQESLNLLYILMFRKV